MELRCNEWDNWMTPRQLMEKINEAKGREGYKSWPEAAKARASMEHDALALLSLDCPLMFQGEEYEAAIRRLKAQ